ncbi:MAG: hypothetical protein JJT94_04105 [Bernardetiaceae bacterium]|nr:hypothetical protein [Bernardetiaceae bacterium]
MLNKHNRSTYTFLVLFLLSFSFFACNNDDDEQNQTPDVPTSNLEMITPASDTAFIVGSELLLRGLSTRENVTLNWSLNGTAIGQGESLAYAFEQTGTFTLQLSDGEDQVERQISVLGKYAIGTLVSHEGVFGQSNASVGFLSPTGEWTSDIFRTENSRPLGDVLQDMKQFGNATYLSVSVSSTVEVVESDNFNSIVTLTGDFANPRYFAEVSSTKAYLSTWGEFDGSVPPQILVLDTRNHSITSRINAGAGANFIHVKNSKAFVSNSFETSITVFDTQTDAQISNISTAPHSPYQMTEDVQGKIWVICYSFDENFNSPEGELLRINPDTEAIEARIPINATGGNIRSLLQRSQDRLRLYFLFSDGVYELPLEGGGSPSKLIDGNFYTLQVQPSTGNIYTSVANFTNEAENEVQIYSNSGTFIESFSVSFGANGFIFRN